MVVDLWDCTQDKPNDGTPHIENPAESNRANYTAFTEALDPQSKGKSSPRADKVLGVLPEKDGQATSHDTSDGRSQQEHPPDSTGRRIDGIENPKLENEDNRRESEGVESDKEETGPSVLVTPKGGRQASEDEQGAEDTECWVYASV